jgi:type IV secretion system protein VirB4
MNIRKFNPRIFIFDRDQSAKLMIQKSVGGYHSFDIGGNKKTPQTLSLNPFQLEDTPRNLGFLVAWVSSLIDPQQANLAPQQKEAIRAAIEQLYQSSESERHLQNLIGILSNSERTLAERLAPWASSGQYGGLFNTPKETLDPNRLLSGFDMNKIARNSALVIPVFSYLVHRIIQSLNGKPTVFVIKDAFDLIENSFFVPRMESLLTMLKQNNVMVIFTFRRPQDAPQRYTFPTIMQQCATHLYIPDDISLPYEDFGLEINDHDASMLRNMQRQKGELLVKQRGESIGLRMHLEGMDDIAAILSNDIKNLVAAGGPFAAIPEEETGD